MLESLEILFFITTIWVVVYWLVYGPLNLFQMFCCEIFCFCLYIFILLCTVLLWEFVYILFNVFHMILTTDYILHRLVSIIAIIAILIIYKIFNKNSLYVVNRKLATFLVHYFCQSVTSKSFSTTVLKATHIALLLK